ncbi:macrophage mannose receptor 1 [Lepeophtheirus salmonis]|uniref:macrophage mannose receptor 1 n=1 Tax=Lepeophtheirus salmonis TaxID=72036 RepID=UPI001AE1C704|nr:macrophage mannose receptor 1-like isoform X1 [Lepeophtheirus salmonis]
MPMNWRFIFFILLYYFESTIGDECPKGWIKSRRNVCSFGLYNIAINYTSALRYCREIHNAGIGDFEDMDELEMMSLHIQTESFIRSSPWMNKVHDLRKVEEGKECTVLTKKGSLSRIDCSQKRGVICSKWNAECPSSDYVNIDNQCYTSIQNPKQYKDAMGFCTALYNGGTILPIIKTSTQNSLIAERFGSVRRWIGLRMRPDKGYFQWSDGSILEENDYSNWSGDGKPPNIEDYQNIVCIVMGEGGLWFIEPCDVEKEFLCQLNPYDTVPPNCKSNHDLKWIEDPHNGLCYTVMHSLLKGENAETSCRYLSIGSNTGTLVSIINPLQQRFFESHLPNDGYSGTYWVGLRNVEGTFTWLDGSPYGFMNWEDQPSYERNHECVNMVMRGGSGKWRTEDCEERLPYICQVKGFNYVDPPEPPSMNNCPIGWIRGGSQCFYTSEKKLKFEEANQFCISKNKESTLAILRDPKAIEEIKGTVHNHSYFIGLNDIKTEGNYVWLDGITDKKEEIPWAPHQPDDKNSSQNCIVMDSSVETWNDVSCNEENRFFCSMEYTVCPPHWTLYNNRCFYLSKESVQCEEGEKQCKAESSQASLASIHSSHENDFLKHLNPITTIDIWIGLKKKSNEESFENWSDGTSIDFTNFSDRDASIDDDQCVRLNTNGYWFPEDANKNNFYSCSLEITHYMNCPWGWKKSRESCYFYMDEELTFQEALHKCDDIHGYLATIPREEAQDFIYSEFKKTRLQAPWVGLSTSKTSNFFLWSDESPTTYTNWNTNFPKPLEGTSCVLMNFQNEGKWENVDCDHKSQAVCETPIQISDLPPSSDAGCTEDQMGYESFCYEIFKSKENYYNGKLHCTNLGGHFITIENEVIQNKLIPFISNSGSNFFIALKYVGGNWVWDYYETPLRDFAYWAPNEPNLEIDDPEGICVEMISRDHFLGKWKTVGCSKKNEVLCQFSRKGHTPKPPTTKETQQPTMDPSFKCPPSYQMIRNKCYKFFNKSYKNFEMARQDCGIYGGDLASFQSLEEEMEVNRYFVDFGLPKTFIGLAEISGLSGFRWLNSFITYGTYTNWGPFEPKCPNYDNNCAFIMNTQWSCGSCQLELNYFCQVNPSDQDFTSNTPSQTNPPQPQCSPGVDDGWFVIPHHDSNVCYKFSKKEKMNWYEAQKFCRRQGGDLVSLHQPSESEYLWIHYASSEYGKDDPWIGLSSIGHEGEGGLFGWSDGSILDYSNWKEGEPSDHMGMESCTHLYLLQEGLWNDDHCGKKKGYICKKFKFLHSTTEALPTTIPSGHCPEGDAEYEGHCYILPKTGPLSWHEAHKQCMDRNYDLLSIHSPQENAFVTSILLSEVQTENVWIGATDQHEYNVFTWSDESDLDITFWGQNQPQGMENNFNLKRNCVFIRVSNPHEIGTWANEDCFLKNMYICKSPVNPKIQTSNFKLPTCPERSDFVIFNKKCFKFFDTEMSWHFAQYVCNSHSAYLISIHDIQLNGFVTAFSEKDSWVGLSSSGSSHNYSLYWEDYSFYDYANFFEDEVIHPERSNCVQLEYMTGKWRVKDCGEMHSFVCQLRSHDGTVDPSSITNCPPFPDWKSTPFEHCYLFETGDAVSHERARLYCEDVGGTLAGIHSKEENQWLLDNIPQEQGTEGNWIGVYRVIDENGEIDQNVFHWSDREPYLGKYTNWAPNGLIEQGLFGVFLPLTGQWSLVPDMLHRKSFICSAKKVKPYHPHVNPTLDPPSTNSTESPKGNNSSSVGLIVGTFVAVLLAIIALSGIVYILEKKKIIRLISRVRKPTYKVRYPMSVSNVLHREDPDL